MVVVEIVLDSLCKLVGVLLVLILFRSTVTVTMVSLSSLSTKVLGGLLRPDKSLSLIDSRAKVLKSKVLSVVEIVEDSVLVASVVVVVVVGHSATKHFLTSVDLP